jgi:hypothetical protein
MKSERRGASSAHAFTRHQPDDEGNGLEEEPDDIIESISQPYLAWSVMD